jgi:hypothetical protein
MKTLLAGVAGAFIRSALLVSGYLWLARDNLIILSLDRGALVENGVMMAMVCGEGSSREILDKVPPNLLDSVIGAKPRVGPLPCVPDDE